MKVLSEKGFWSKKTLEGRRRICVAAILIILFVYIASVAWVAYFYGWIAALVYSVIGGFFLCPMEKIFFELLRLNAEGGRRVKN